MANEIWISADSSKTLYAIIYRTSDMKLYVPTGGTFDVVSPAWTDVWVRTAAINLITTPRLGAELVVDNVFGVADKWILGDGWSYASGPVREFVGAGVYSGTLSQTIPVVVGTYYKLTYTVVGGVVGVTPSCAGWTGTAQTADGTYSELFSAANANDLVFTPSTVDDDFYFTSVSVKAATITGDLHIADFPIVAAGMYLVQIREQAGANPDTDDVMIGQGVMYWDGAAEIDINAVHSDLEITDTVVDTILELRNQQLNVYDER